MEQYIHTLIAADPAYFPRPTQVAEFFERLLTSSSFRLISGGPFQQGLRAAKASGRFRTFTDPISGENKQFPIFDSIKISGSAEIPTIIENLEEFRVLASGEWKLDSPLLVLLTSNRKPFGDNYYCEVSCHLRPAPVSTSCPGFGPNQNIFKVPMFGEPCDALNTTGIFANPRTGKVIEIPGAARARFWIEYEFGKFLFPEIGENFDVLDPLLVENAEATFQARFIQGYRYY